MVFLSKSTQGLQEAFSDLSNWAQENYFITNKHEKKKNSMVLRKSEKLAAANSTSCIGERLKMYAEKISPILRQSLSNLENVKAEYLNSVFHQSSRHHNLRTSQQGEPS
jgi:hypothetical protein